MKNITPNKNRLIVFSRWSRKGYAVFNSLGINVKIGHVSIDICNVSIRKTSALKRAILSLLLTETDDKENIDCDDVVELEILNTLLINNITTLQRAITFVPKNELNYFYINKRVFAFTCRHPFLFFKSYDKRDC
jgi:hypothetical protein